MADSTTIVSVWNSAQDNQQELQQQQQPQPAQEVQARVPQRVCVACRRRKVGCDKKQPCQDCKKSGSECSYPADNSHGSEEPQMLRDTGLLERLHRLEPMLKTLASYMEQGTALPFVSVPNSSVLSQTVPGREDARVSPTPPTPPRSVGSHSTGTRPGYALAGPEQPATIHALSPPGQPSPLQDADLAAGAQSKRSDTASGGSSQGVSPKEMSGLVESPYGTSMGKRDDGRQRYVSGTFWEALHTEVINYIPFLSLSWLISLISSTTSTRP